MAETYDLIVIGAGPAGQSSAELAAAFGRRALIAEQRQPGGVVTTTGGAPTKTLREAARSLTGFRQQEVYGVRSALPLAVALPIIGARTAHVRDRLQGGGARQIAARGIAYVHGAARRGPNGAIRVTLPDGAARERAAASDVIHPRCADPGGCQSIGLRFATIAARCGSRNGASTTFSPSVAASSSTVNPGPSEAISNRMPLGSRKYRLRNQYRSTFPLFGMRNVLRRPAQASYSSKVGVRNAT